jgi:hypothetical protein
LTAHPRVDLKVSVCMPVFSLILSFSLTHSLARARALSLCARIQIWCMLHVCVPLCLYLYGCLYSLSFSRSLSPSLSRASARSLSVCACASKDAHQRREDGGGGGLGRKGRRCVPWLSARQRAPAERARARERRARRQLARLSCPESGLGDGRPQHRPERPNLGGNPPGRERERAPE